MVQSMMEYQGPKLRRMTDWDVFKLLVPDECYRISEWPAPDTVLIILCKGGHDGSQFVFDLQGKLIAVHP